MEDITDEIYDLQLSMSNGSKVPCTITNRNEINCSSSVYTDHTGKNYLSNFAKVYLSYENNLPDSIFRSFDHFRHSFLKLYHYFYS